MGFYDCRCLITGVSLKGADAALVPLQEAGDAFAPVALAVKGNYNRLGLIDGIDEDDNTAQILRYFLAQLQAGAFVVQEDYLQISECFPFRDIEQLLQAFERNINDNPQAAVLNRQPVVFALVARKVWDALARAAPRSREPGSALLRRAFQGSEVAEAMYGDSLEEVADHLREMAAVSDFMAERRIGWAPPADPSQHYSDEIRQFLEEAQRSFADSAVVMRSLESYKREIHDSLADD